MSDLVETVAAFIRAHPRAERGQLALAIVTMWPGIEARELQAAIDRSTRRPRLVLAHPERRA